MFVFMRQMTLRALDMGIFVSAESMVLRRFGGFSGLWKPGGQSLYIFVLTINTAMLVMRSCTLLIFPLFCCDLGVDMVLLDEIGAKNVQPRATKVLFSNTSSFFFFSTSDVFGSEG